MIIFGDGDTLENMFRCDSPKKSIKFRFPIKVSDTTHIPTIFDDMLNCDLCVKNERDFLGILARDIFAELTLLD